MENDVFRIIEEVIDFLIELNEDEEFEVNEIL